MWYFAWILGLGFAVLLAILSAIWLEFEKDRSKVFGEKSSTSPQETSDES